MKKISVSDEVAQETFTFMKKQIVKKTKKDILIVDMIDLVMRSLATLNVNMVHSIKHVVQLSGQSVSIDSLQKVFGSLMAINFEELKERAENEKQEK